MDASADYLCVRVVNMSGVDLTVFTFDTDLTFAVLLMNGDGTIYHRYGARTWEDAESRISMKSLVATMKGALETHAAYVKDPKPPKEKSKRTIEDQWKEAGRAKTPECFHCHMVGGTQTEIDQAKGRWNPSEIYRQPMPERLGMTLDRDDQTLVTDVMAKSPAEKAGIAKGDRLARVEGARVLSIADVQWQLDGVTDKGATIEIDLEGGRAVKVKTKSKWKEADPLDVSWRSTMWAYAPQPGFGGPRLTDDELKAAGLAAGSFAFKVNYLVTWAGPGQKYGNNAQQAGIKKGDIVVSVDGVSDFKSEQHVQAWFRLTRKPGGKAAFEILRGGKRQTVQVPIIP